MYIVCSLSVSLPGLANKDVHNIDMVICFQDNVSTLLPVFEQCLSDAPATASYDALRHSVVILMGTLAKHLDADNPKVRPIVGLLIETLSTPSQQVLYFTLYNTV